MIPSPLHPALVHMPLAIVALLPFAALAALLFIRKGAGARALWSVVVVLHLLLVVGVWAASMSGEAEEEAVEMMVPEAPMEIHEERAELLLFASVLALLLAASGLIAGKNGRTARLACTLATVVLLVLGVRVGETGGNLVYRYGAAQAFSATDETPAPRHNEESHDEDHDEDD